MLPEDAEIIKQVLGGNTNAFAALIDRYKSMAFTIAYRFLKNREDAEEAAQDASINAYKNLASFRHDSKFSTWLYRIVYNQCANRARKKSCKLFRLIMKMLPMFPMRISKALLTAWMKKTGRK